MAQLPAQTIRAAGVLLIQDQLGDTVDHYLADWKIDQRVESKFGSQIGR